MHADDIVVRENRIVLLVAEADGSSSPAERAKHSW